jgi:predicted DNA-binding transcriptional regulator AlpA
MSQAQEEKWEEYLTEKQVSDITSFSVNTLQNWRVQGKGPVYVKPGGKCVRYPASSLRAFMEERRGGGES